MNNTGIVIIGRNEGERFQRCINTLLSKQQLTIVYVDSASTDNSVEFARSKGCDVVELDMSIPFSAARARNEGYRYLLEKFNHINFIQFIDGDCEIQNHWLDIAADYLSNNPQVAAVCGQCRERFPNASIYNQLCDIEWGYPSGEIKATGGNFMCRSEALVDSGGFNETVIAGEEPEFCYRLRQSGWLIHGLPVAMVLHDAAMTSWKQWWKRSERSGHAYMQGYWMHGNNKEHYNRTNVLRIIFWALAIPLLIATLSASISPWYLLFLLISPIKILQMTLSNPKKLPFKTALLYSTALMIGKFPQFIGVLKFTKKLLLKENFEIIEHKS